MKGVQFKWRILLIMHTSGPGRCRPDRRASQRALKHYGGKAEHNHSLLQAKGGMNTTSTCKRVFISRK